MRRRNTSLAIAGSYVGRSGEPYKTPAAYSARSLLSSDESAENARAASDQRRSSK